VIKGDSYLQKLLILLVSMVWVMVLTACGGENIDTPPSDPAVEDDQSNEDTPPENNISELTKETAVKLMKEYQESFVSLINETKPNDLKIESFQSKADVQQHFTQTMADELAQSMTDTYFTEKEDGVYVIAQGGPTWLEEEQPFDFEVVSDQHVKIVQERDNEYLGHVRMVYHIKYQENQWCVAEVQREDLPVTGLTSGETAQMIINILANKDMATLATYVHPDKGVLFSPYVYIDEDALVFSQSDVEIFLAQGSQQTYTWGVYDGVGDTIELTQSEYYEEFIYDQNFQEAGEVLVDELKPRGNMINNIKEIFPDAKVVEFHLEGTEEYSGMDWASLNLVLEKDENNEWKLVAIVHDQWTT
jgi:hypothetical protein